MEIRLTLEVAAPAEICFDVARDVDLHVASTAHTSERAVAGRTSGLIELGEEVTWKARHFGVWLRHTARITAFDRPSHFQDAMVRGAFKSFVHDHFFESLPTGDTRVTDALSFSSPLGPLGALVDRVVLRRYLERLLRTRNQLLKQVAEEGGAAVRRAAVPATSPPR